MSQKDPALSRLEEEWKMFTSAVFHDLAPIARRLDTYAHFIIEETNKEELNVEELQSFAQSIASSATSFADYLRAIRAYSHVSFSEPSLESIYFQQLLEQIKDRYANRLEGGITFELSAVPQAILSHTQLLDLCLSHLIDNALVSVSRVENALIRVRADIVEDDWIHIKIEDNGIGFSPELKEKMFRLFEKVHSRKEYPHDGPGAGLAIAQKAAERLGGKIEAQGSPGEGATFILVIPFLPA